MNFFADRMARAMDELIAIAPPLDDLPAGVVDFPAEWMMAGCYFCLDEGQCRVPSLADQVEDLAMFHWHRLTDIAGPGNIGVDRTGLRSFSPEINQEQCITCDLVRPLLWRTIMGISTVGINGGNRCTRRDHPGFAYTSQNKLLHSMLTETAALCH